MRERRKTCGCYALYKGFSYQGLMKKKGSFAAFDGFVSLATADPSRKLVHTRELQVE